MDQRWGVGISGGNVERGNLTPDREGTVTLVSVGARPAAFATLPPPMEAASTYQRRFDVS